MVASLVAAPGLQNTDSVVVEQGLVTPNVGSSQTRD